MAQTNRKDSGNKKAIPLQDKAARKKAGLRFSNLFSLAPIGYLVMDEKGEISDCNDYVWKMLGSSRSSIIKKGFQRYIHPSDADGFDLFVRAIKKEKGPVETSLRLLNKAGETLYVNVQGAIFLEPESGLKFFYVAIINVTEKRLVEIAQKQTSERLLLALEGSTSGSWEINLSDGIVKLDNISLRLFGFNGTEFNGHFEELIEKIHPDDRQRVDMEVRAAFSGNVPLSTECMLVNELPKPQYLELRGRKIKLAPDKETFVGMVADVSGRKALEQETVQLKLSQQKSILKAVIETQEHERTRISNALHDSLGQLLYGVSLKLQHTLGTNSPSFKDAVELLEMSIKETRNIAFELAPAILTDYGLTAALPEMIKRLKTTNLKITFDIHGFQKRLSQQAEIFVFRIAQELLNNTIKHSDAKKASLEIHHQAGTIHICMRDNGRGFLRKKMQSSGTGLYSIKNRIALYNGTLKISKSPKNETSVEIELQNVE